MYTYIFCYCLIYRVTVIFDKVTVSTNFTLCVSFTLRRKVFKVLTFSALICELVLSVFVYILEVFNYDKL